MTGVPMLAHHFLNIMKELDRNLKLILGIWGSLVAPIMIWTGVALLIIATLGVDLELANPGLFGLQLFLLGLLWELMIYYTFIDA
jgi:hypothetical protein